MSRREEDLPMSKPQTVHASEKGGRHQNWRRWREWEVSQPVGPCEVGTVCVGVIFEAFEEIRGNLR